MCAFIYKKKRLNKTTESQENKCICKLALVNTGVLTTVRARNLQCRHICHDATDISNVVL